jgi:hypothetical protein
MSRTEDGTAELIPPSASHLTEAGAFFGAIAGYPLIENFGRKWTLLGTSVLFNVGCIVQIAASHEIGLIYGGRVIVGFAVGLVTCVCPVYLAELSPPAIRGRLVGFCPSPFSPPFPASVLTLFFRQTRWRTSLSSTPARRKADLSRLSQLPNHESYRFLALVRHQGEHGHEQHGCVEDPLRHPGLFPLFPLYTRTRLTMPRFLQLIPGGLLFIGCFFLKESPRYLLKRHRPEEATANLCWLRNLPPSHTYIEEELSATVVQINREKEVTATHTGNAVTKYCRGIWAEVSRKGIRNRLIIGAFIMMWQSTSPLLRVWSSSN